MTLDKHEAEIVAAAAEFIARACPFTGSPHAEALRAILPKPRFYAVGRGVRDRRLGGGALYVNGGLTGDDALAALIAQDIADVLNKRLGEDAS